jgi:hypothetical protein
VIRVELRKLLEVGFIKEVFHPTWPANPVLVKKKNGKNGKWWVHQGSSFSFATNRSNH